MGLSSIAFADIVTTQESITTEQSLMNRTQANDFFNRADVRQALEAKGISVDAAISRLDAMSDAEVSQLVQRLDKAPAGGEIIGVIFTVFIVLLVTDILGLTKVFPFTRSVR
jgi:hypothetical protein